MRHPDRLTVRADDVLRRNLKVIKDRLRRDRPGCAATTSDAIRYAVAEAALHVAAPSQKT